jgi:hypothetical protein
LPILNHLLERIQFPQILESMLPREGRRVRVPAAPGLVMLLKN